MRAEDAPAVAELTTQLGYPAGPAAQATRIADLLARPADHAPLVALDASGAVVGWVHVMRQRYLEGDATAVIMGLVVDDRARSAGIGARLTEAAEAWARKAGCTRMTVRSRVTRERAHGFYLRHGYVLDKTSYVFRKPLT